MNRFLFPLVFAIGLGTVAWVSAGFVGSSGLALVMTLVIAAVYGAGAWELLQFRRSTALIQHAINTLGTSTPSLDAWITRLPPQLQQPIRSRMEGERSALPAPALTPYLVGLLVMLGMLGTFLGMVVTFKGAVFALEGSTDLQAIRSALAAPIKGLGLSFGTSVAGVAASAMLGLLSALSRRERMLVSRQLDGLAATTWKTTSRAFQREETLKALQLQGQSLPLVVEQLQAMVLAMEQRELAHNTAMANRQTQFHQEVSSAYTQLADSVGQSLQTSLATGARMAQETTTPIVESAMRQMAQSIEHQQHAVGETVQRQLTELGLAVGATARTASDTLALALANQTQGNQALVGQLSHALENFAQQWGQQSSAVLSQLQEAAAHAQARQNTADAQRLQVWTRTLESSATAQQADWATLTSQTRAAQQAACDIMQSCAVEFKRLGAHDQQALQEQAKLMERLQALAEASRATTDAQQTAITNLVAASHSMLGKASNEFVALLDSHAQRSGEVAVHVHSSAIELSSLGEALQVAVAQFAKANDQMMGSLQSVEAAISQSMERSDEQLAYYVGQAREVIDLSLSSQRAVVEDLRSLRAKPMAAAEIAA